MRGRVPGGSRETLKANEGEIAAVIVEPMVQGAAGMVVHPEGFLKGVRDLTRKYQTLLIADEVAVVSGGRGRSSPANTKGSRPTSCAWPRGSPAVICPGGDPDDRRGVFRVYGTLADGKTFYHGHTYGGNPLGAAVALASLRVFDEERTLEALRPKIGRLRDRLAEFALLPHVGDVRQRGLLAGVELVKDRASKERFDPSEQVGYRVCMKAREFGLLIRPLGDVLVMMPPLSISEGQIDEMVNVMIRCTREITEGAASA